MPDVLRSKHPTVTPQRYAHDLYDEERDACSREFLSMKAAFVCDGLEVFEDSRGNPGLELTAER